MTTNGDESLRPAEGVDANADGPSATEPESTPEVAEKLTEEFVPSGPSGPSDEPTAAQTRHGKAGLPEAVDLASVAANGPISNPLALRHERLQGKVTKFVPSSGWGFLESHFFQGELSFKIESILPECQNYEFAENEGVEFHVQPDERGRPQAVALKPIVGRKPSDCIGQRHRGYIRRFADRWGFLNAAAFDGDLFVHRDNLLLLPEQMLDGQPPLRSQQAVEFDVASDDRGRTVAKQITTSAILRPPDWIGRRLPGVIRSFQGAWGFINCDKFAGDLFVHRDSVMQQFQGIELQPGMPVEFDVERDQHKKSGRNRLVARQVAISAHPALYAGYAQPPMYCQGPQPAYPDPQMVAAYGQPPPYYDPYALASQHQVMMAPQGHFGQPVLPYGQPVTYGQPALAQPQYGQAPYAVPPQVLPSDPAMPAPSVQTVPNQAPEASGAPPEPPQVQLHMTTHTWEPDQAGQLKVQKGTLVNVSHRAAHGWVYAATVQHAGQVPPAPVSEGWMPQAVAKRVSLCRAVADWSEEGAGTLGLLQGDLIAVSKEAERGWVYGERINPNRTGPVDGWLPKKVLEYVLM